MSEAAAPNAAWFFPLCPEPVGAPIDWPGLEACFPVLRDMASCRQEPEYHAEGDVLTHTKWVCEELVSLESWRALPRQEQCILFLAAALHDVGKPLCTVEEGGRVSSPGHARKGAQLVRQWIYRPESAGEAFGLPIPFHVREQIVALVRHHGLPLSFLLKDSPERAVITASQSARCDHLAILAEADARGRVCATRQELLDRVGFFRDVASELHCSSAPYAFPSDHARMVYFEKPSGLPTYAAFDDTVCQVVLMSGLPGAGKDHWRAAKMPGAPVISLDALRLDMKIDPADDQGEVVARAKSDARGHLRAGRPFVWNATNTTRPLRWQLIDLFRAYRARVRIVYLEAPYREVRRRIQSRPDPMPMTVLDRLVRRLDVPDLTEAHSVEWEVG